MIATKVGAFQLVVCFEYPTEGIPEELSMCNVNRG